MPFHPKPDHTYCWQEQERERPLEDGMLLEARVGANTWLPVQVQLRGNYRPQFVLQTEDELEEVAFYLGHYVELRASTAASHLRQNGHNKR